MSVETVLPVYPSVIPSKNYERSNSFDTYALGVNYIRSIPLDSNYKQPTFVKLDGTTIYRPLTMLESLEAVVINYNVARDLNGDLRSVVDRFGLKLHDKFTCTGISYKKDVKKITEIKIIPESKELINISSDTKDFLDVSYDSVDGTIIKINKIKYNKALKYTELLEDPLWIASVGDTQYGRIVLKEFAHVFFSTILNFSALSFSNIFRNSKPKYGNSFSPNSSDRGLGFYLLPYTNNNLLRPLCLKGLGCDCVAQAVLEPKNVYFILASQKNTLFKN